MKKSPFSVVRAWLRLKAGRTFDRPETSGNATGQLRPDFDEKAGQIISAVQPFTMTSPERLFGLIEAIRYIEQCGVPGAIVECGVWRGGSMMAVALTLLGLGKTSRDLYLFDTFSGMTPPAEADVSFSGSRAVDEYQASDASQSGSAWCFASYEEVRKEMLGTGYPEELVHFVKGDVLETVPAFAPETIAVLRLDTDWYTSTRHELEALFPRLASGGVLIIDDYGHWRGARQATDEYLHKSSVKMLLNRMDYTGRIGIKP